MSHDDLCAAVPRSLRVRGSIAIAGVRLPTTIFMVAVAALALSAALIVTGTPVSESLSIVAPPAAAAVAAHEVRWRGYGVIAVLLMLLRHIGRPQCLEWSAASVWCDGAPPRVMCTAAVLAERGDDDA
jgi:hypothetical protein